MKIPEEEIEKAKDFFIKFVSKGKDKIVSEALVKMYKETKRVEVERSEKGFINFLYWKENKSLREIGGLYGLTCESIRWKMIKYDIKRRKRGWPKGKSHKKEDKFKSLEEYFSYVRKTGKESLFYLHKLIDPQKRMWKCSVCGGKKSLRLHYLKRPATSIEDIQILCSTCFYANLREKGINNLIRDEICRRYIRGEKGTELAKEYKVSTGNIYRILKIRDIKTRKRCSKYSVVEKLKTINSIDYDNGKTLEDRIKKFKISIPTYYKWKKGLKEGGILR